MLRAVETAIGEEIGERDQPSTEYVAQLLEEIEQDDITAHSLDEVASRKESQSLQLQSSLDQSGRVRIVRQRAKGKLPLNTEELRQKLRVEANAWLMVASKLRNKVYLRGLEQRHFDRYIAYLLGDKCYLMQVPNSAGEKAPLQPPWHILLDYEYEMRKKAIRTAHRDGTALHVELKAATENTELKELYFTSPVTFSAIQRPPKTARYEEASSSKGYGQQGKGKSKKGKGKGANKEKYKVSYLPGTQLELVTHTPDGKEICYRYNIKASICDVGEHARSNPKDLFEALLRDNKSYSATSHLTVVYVFAGHRRKADVREHLQHFADSHSVTLCLYEFDLLLDESHDVLNTSFWSELLRFTTAVRPFCIFVTPPCSTYSRARHFYKQSPGPRPVRSRQHPNGFPWLFQKDRRKAEEGTLFAEKAWELINLAISIGSHYLAEFPEDLGQTSTGVPASLWQMQQFQDVLATRGARTFALFQCEYGAETPKPTRFVASLRCFSGNIYEGAPTFDSEWRYLGPLPPSCPHPGAHQALIGTNDSGAWKTSPAAHYPGPLCKFLAEAVGGTWLESSATVGKHLDSSDSGCYADDNLDFSWGQDADDLVVDNSNSNNSNSDVAIQSGCKGPPLKASYSGKSEEFCDGLGLCSPGRWHPAMRQLDKDGQQIEACLQFRKMLDEFCIRNIQDMARATFEVALGRLSASYFDEEALKGLRMEWFSLLPDPRQAAVLEEDQPFYLHALAQSLRMTGDPDVDIIDSGSGSNFAQGVHLGHLEALGPTPQVFHPKEKKTAYDDSDWDLEMKNYFSGTEAEAERILSQQFTEEELAGRMVPISEAEARKQYPGESLRIAAQGILEKPDGSYRIVHDGTHGVHLNNQIVIKDKMDNPGPREMACVMETSKASNEHVVFAVNADISKAHRRVRIRKGDWGVQAARTSSSSRAIWLNKVGTFGVASAAFWWSRLMGLIGRFAISICLQDWLFVLTFVDDLHIAVGGKNRWLTFWRFMACLEMVGIPFSYKKFAGGFQLEYVGFWLDYTRFELGVSEKRTNWLIKFVDDLETSGWLVNARRYQEFHGRLGFASQILPWIRPLLAPGYAWLSAVGKMTTLKVPELVAVVCMFIRSKLKSGLRKVPCCLKEKKMGELFRTDAKCEAGRIVLGGWRLCGSGDTTVAPWFVLELFPKDAPWLFRGETFESSWASTAAELLAALVAIKVFKIEEELKGHPGIHVLHCGGGVDNRAVDALTSRRLSTKLPVMLVLIEYLNHCELVGLRCHLDWRPRETNVPADDLTNLKFDKFRSEHRIETSWNQLDLPMLNMLSGFVDSFKKRKLMETPKDRWRSPKFQKSHWG